MDREAWRAIVLGVTKSEQPPGQQSQRQRFEGKNIYVDISPNTDSPLKIFKNICLVTHKKKQQKRESLHILKPALQCDIKANPKCTSISLRFREPFIVFILESIKVKVTQLYLTLCDPMYCTVGEILQARILEWVAIPFSRGSSQPRDRTQVSCIADRFFTS